MTSLCASIDTLAMTYLDDELADEELRDFEMHMIDCAGCRARVDAERDALADLRSRLAPPATPDVVRARLRATLDAEDDRASRDERKSRVAGWLLPGAASVAAVAALVLFAFSRIPEPAPESVASDVVRTQMKSPEIVIPTSVGEAMPIDAPVFGVAEWRGQTTQRREVVNRLYRVRLAPGVERALQRSDFDARGLALEPGVYSVDGQIVVAYRTSNGRAYLFSSPDLAVQDMVSVIERFDLVPE
jgi:hypothetical protein